MMLPVYQYLLKLTTVMNIIVKLLFGVEKNLNVVEECQRVHTVVMKDSFVLKMVIYLLNVFPKILLRKNLVVLLDISYHPVLHYHLVLIMMTLCVRPIVLMLDIDLLIVIQKQDLLKSVNVAVFQCPILIAQNLTH